MEKKNTILLTVIAIATLLVAVVGATFAYFTAQVTQNNEDNANTNVTTAILPTATIDYKSDVSEADVYPGAMIVKELNITASCPDGKTCTSVDAVITVTENIPDTFGEDISWKLYKSDTALTCTNAVAGADTNQYHMVPTCKKGDTDDATNFSGLTPVLTSADATKEYTVKNITTSTDDNYYLVITYYNNEAAEQKQQGAGFDITLGFKAA